MLLVIENKETLMTKSGESGKRIRRLCIFKDFFFFLAFYFPKSINNSHFDILNLKINLLLTPKFHISSLLSQIENLEYL